MTITETIKYITKLRNKSIRTDSKKFKEYLNAYSPECVKELKLLNRALNDNILSIIFSSEQDSTIISKLTTEFKNMGMPDKLMNFILESFAEVLGWNYPQTPQKQEEPPIKREEPIIKREEPIIRQEEPTIRQEEPTIKQEELTIKQEEPPIKQEEPPIKREESIIKQEEPPIKREESIIKQEEPIIKQETTKETIENIKETRERLSEKKIQENDPNLLPFIKPLMGEIKKKNLEDITARVALVMDISGSMSINYSNGKVQEIVNKILPIAIEFDDDEELDFWYYGSKIQRIPPVNLKNYKSAIPSDWPNLMSSLGYGNNEPLVIKDVINNYQNSKLPTFVIFISDGGFCTEVEFDENETEQLLIDSSKMPIFWQFVGIGNATYGLLENLKNLKGQYTDNAHFFALDDFRSVSNSELYSRLLNKFPSWLKEAKEKKILK